MADVGSAAAVGAGLDLCSGLGVECLGLDGGEGADPAARGGGGGRGGWCAAAGHTADRDGPAAGGAGLHLALKVDSGRVNVVVREGVPEMVGGGVVQDAGVVVGARPGVEGGGLLGGRLVGVVQQGGAVEGGGEPCAEIAHQVVARGEGRVAAGEDRKGGRFGEAADSGEGEGVAVHPAGDGSPGELGVDAQVGGAVLVPHLVYVVVEVTAEQGAVAADCQVGAEYAQVAAARGDDQPAPVAAVGGGLGPQRGGDPGQSVGGQPAHRLGSLPGLQLEGDRQRDHVDERNVGVQLVAVEGEFAEVVSDVRVGIGRVAHRWQGQTAAAVHQKGELRADGEVDTAAVQARQRHPPRSAAGLVERDGTVDPERGLIVGRSRRVVQAGAVGLDEGPGAAGSGVTAEHIGVHRVVAGGVHQVQGERGGGGRVGAHLEPGCRGGHGQGQARCYGEELSTGHGSLVASRHGGGPFFVRSGGGAERSDAGRG
ncbi:hypothetical protein SAVIM40S_05446 [Streptomyces avidinii]